LPAGGIAGSFIARACGFVCCLNIYVFHFVAGAVPVRPSIADSYGTVAVYRGGKYAEICSVFDQNSSETIEDLLGAA
jgi:hypothetical protein